MDFFQFAERGDVSVMPDRSPMEIPGSDESQHSRRVRPLINALIVLAALVAFGRDGLAAEPSGVNVPSESRSVRLLFAGSSSTYWNDLPGEVARIVNGQMAGHEGKPVTAEIVGRSGIDIRVYLNPDCNYQYGVKPGQSFLNKVRDEKFDFVVLMVVCRFITGDGKGNEDGQAHREAVTEYCQAIRTAGGEPIFYEMGWGKGDREEEGRRRIMALARQNRIKLFAPCSSAWSRVYEERPDLALQHPQDSSHPGNLGHFLNLACFYAALTRTSPEGKLPREFHVWPHLNKAQKEARKAELNAAYARFEPNAYQARLPEWMRRNAGAGFIGQISDDDARYLELIAWECVQNALKQLEPTAPEDARSPSERQQ